MARRLYAMLPIPGEPIEFALATEKGMTLVSADTADFDASDEVVIFVPATEVGCFEVRLPNQGVAELRRSAAFALEDDLAVAVEDAHVAIGQPLPGGSRPVHIVDPALMEQWVSILGLARHAGRRRCRGSHPDLGRRSPFRCGFSTARRRAQGIRQ